MRICFIDLQSYGFFNTDYYTKTGGGGTSRQVYVLSRQLADNHDVNVIVGDYGQPSQENIHNVNIYSAYKPETTPRYVAFFKLLHLMKNLNCESYIYHGGPWKASFIGPMTQFIDANWVYHMASDEDLGENYTGLPLPIKILFKWSLLASDVVISQTEAQNDNLQSKFGVSSHVVPMGYPELSQEYEKTAEYILWVGRVSEEKRPHLLIKIAKRLPEYDFHVVGPCSKSQYCSQFKAKAKKVNNLILVGSVPPDELSAHYARAAILINTSKYEGFPNTFLEAWRQGIPVISLSVDPGRYLDEELYSGYANGSISNLSEMIIKMRNNRELKNTRGEQLKRYFENNYSINTVAKKYEAVLRS